MKIHQYSSLTLSLSYKTERGAQVRDLFMSLIHTCRLGGFNPFDYLSALVRNGAKVRTRPDQWLPWNFRETLEIVARQASSRRAKRWSLRG
jgi:transposase